MSLVREEIKENLMSYIRMSEELNEFFSGLSKEEQELFLFYFGYIWLFLRQEANKIYGYESMPSLPIVVEEKEFNSNPLETLKKAEAQFFPFEGDEDSILNEAYTRASFVSINWAINFNYSPVFNSFYDKSKVAYKEIDNFRIDIERTFSKGAYSYFPILVYRKKRLPFFARIKNLFSGKKKAEYEIAYFIDVISALAKGNNLTVWGKRVIIEKKG